jgi:hypothetical protein
MRQSESFPHCHSAARRSHFNVIHVPDTTAAIDIMLPKQVWYPTRFILPTPTSAIDVGARYWPQAGCPYECRIFQVRRCAPAIPAVAPDEVLPWQLYDDVHASPQHIVGHRDRIGDPRTQRSPDALAPTAQSSEGEPAVLIARGDPDVGQSDDRVNIMQEQ